VDIGVTIFIIAVDIITKLVVLGSLLMIGCWVGSRMVSWGRSMVSWSMDNWGWSMVSWGMDSWGWSMVSWGSMDNRDRGIGRSRGIGGWRAIRVTGIRSRQKGQGNESLHSCRFSS